MQSFMSRVTRVLIVLAFLLLLAGVTLFWMGGRQRQYKSHVTINAPKEVVFQYLTDNPKIQAWSSGVAQVQPQSEGGHQKGAKSHISVTVSGYRLEIDSEVLETIADDRLITALNSPQMTARSDFQLEESNGQTILSHSFQVSPRGMSRFFAPFSGTQLQQQLDTGLENLKHFIERENLPPRTP